jgi:hypothetical protein
MIKILIYFNCHGSVLLEMFKKYLINKDFKIDLIVNYMNLNNKKISEDHLKLILECDIFIYQFFNNKFDSEYDSTNIIKLLKSKCIVKKINYYRFSGFWYENTCNPFYEYEKWTFNKQSGYGIHKDFVNFESDNIVEITKKIDSIKISSDFDKYFEEQLNNFKLLDNNSDVKMYDYFIQNYKKYHLFHDLYHPTNLFFYEMFRQLILSLFNNLLTTDDNKLLCLLISEELTNWATPILPAIKTHLNLNIPDRINVFRFKEQLLLNIYEYYYIRLSEDNFKNYLLN